MASGSRRNLGRGEQSASQETVRAGGGWGWRAAAEARPEKARIARPLLSARGLTAPYVARVYSSRADAGGPHIPAWGDPPARAAGPWHHRRGCRARDTHPPQIP